MSFITSQCIIQKSRFKCGITPGHGFTYWFHMERAQSSFAETACSNLLVNFWLVRWCSPN